MKKRNRKLIKLMAGSLAVTSMFSACARNTREDRVPETVYVYVTATPTPTPVVEQTQNTTQTSATAPSVSSNNGNWAEDGAWLLSDDTQNTTPTTTVYVDNGNWAEDGDWLFDVFYGDNTTPTSETTVDEYWALNDEEEAFLSSLYNRFVSINERIDNFSFSEARDDAVSEARQLIDFIFYGAEMNGTTFAELTDQARLAVYQRLQALDARIMEFYPDYKTDLGELYNRVRDFLSTAYENAREAFGSHISINVEINPTETTMNAPRARKELKLKK